MQLRRRRAGNSGRAEPARGDVRRLRRQFLHRHGDRPRSRAHRRALHPSRATPTSSSRPALTANPCSRTWRRSRTHPQFNLKTMLAHRATADVALLKLKAPHAGYIAPLHPSRPRVAVGERFVVRGYGATIRGNGNSAGRLREATLVAIGKPGNLQLRLVDPATRRQAPGPRRLHRRFRRAGLSEDELRLSRPVRRGELVDRAQLRGRLRRPHRREWARRARSPCRQDRSNSCQPRRRISSARARKSSNVLMVDFLSIVLRPLALMPSPAEPAAARERDGDGDGDSDDDDDGDDRGLDRDRHGVAAVRIGAGRHRLDFERAEPRALAARM